MHKQHHPAHVVSYAVLFLLLLLALATGPIGFALLIMAGVPIAAFVAFGASLTRSRTHSR